MAFRHTLLIAPLLLALTACETAQENPNYEYSSTYNNDVPSRFAQNSRHPDQLQTAAPVRYVSTPQTQNSNLVQASSQGATANGTYTRVNHACVNNAAINCTPVPLQATTQQAVITPAYAPNYTLPADHQNAAQQNEPLARVFSEPLSEADYAPSPTENTYSADTVGTPGYEAIRQSQSLSAQSILEAQPSYQTYQPVAQPSAQPAPQAQYAGLQQTYTGGQSVTQNNANSAATSVVPVTAPAAAPLWPSSQTSLDGSYIVQAGDTVYSLSRGVCASVSEVQTLNRLDQNFSIQTGQTLKLPQSRC